MAPFLRKTVKPNTFVDISEEWQSKKGNLLKLSKVLGKQCIICTLVIANLLVRVELIERRKSEEEYREEELKAQQLFGKRDSSEKVWGGRETAL